MKLLLFYLPFEYEKSGKLPAAICLQIKATFPSILNVNKIES